MKLLIIILSVMSYNVDALAGYNGKGRFCTNRVTVVNGRKITTTRCISRVAYLNNLMNDHTREMLAYSIESEYKGAVK